MSVGGVFDQRFRLTLSGILIYNTTIFVFKNRDVFITLNHDYFTRIKRALIANKVHLKVLKSLNFNFGTKTFDFLPANLKTATSLNFFKTKLRIMLVESTPYTYERIDGFVAILEV